MIEWLLELLFLGGLPLLDNFFSMGFSTSSKLFFLISLFLSEVVLFGEDVFSEVLIYTS